MNFRALLFGLLCAFLLANANATPNDVGIVLLHGKQASPSAMLSLAQDLRAAGYKVATPEMPWSQGRELDVAYPEALVEMDAAAATLVKEGAKDIVVGGHSFGANGAIAYASSGRPVLGIFALSPGHVPERGRFREIAAPGVDRARELVAAGKPQEKAWFPDVNQGQARQIRTTAAAYLSYFDPEGIAAMPKSAAAIPRPVPMFMAVGNSDVISGYAETAIYQAAPRHEKSVYLAQAGDHMSTIRISTPALLKWLKALSPWVREKKILVRSCNTALVGRYGAIR